MWKNLAIQMRQSVSRYIVISVFAFLIGKGFITNEEASSYIPHFESFIALVLGTGGMVFWSWLEKKWKGTMPPPPDKKVSPPADPNSTLLPP